MESSSSSTMMTPQSRYESILLSQRNLQSQRTNTVEQSAAEAISRAAMMGMFESSPSLSQAESALKETIRWKDDATDVCLGTIDMEAGWDDGIVPEDPDVDSFFESFPECVEEDVETGGDGDAVIPDPSRDHHPGMNGGAADYPIFRQQQQQHQQHRTYPPDNRPREILPERQNGMNIASPPRLQNHHRPLHHPNNFYNNPYANQPPPRQDSDASWDAHNIRHGPQKTNPFQTAREFAKSGGGGGSQASDPESHPQQRKQPNPPSSSPARPLKSRSNFSAGLKRKFQPPKKTNNAPPRKTTTPDENDDDEELPEGLKGLDKDLIAKIQSEILDNGESVTFDSIAGLAQAKQTVLELVCWPMKRPDLFTGLRRGPNGLLLFGPPGTGKTLIGKAIAHESGATFFSISSSSLTSKWIGEGEKLVRTLFAVAAYKQPSVVFIDEIDSLLTKRSADENEASRRMKTEFLVQLDGTGGGGGGDKMVLVIGATNRPGELDDAARRRFVKRLYIPLPEAPDRAVLIQTLLQKNNHDLSSDDVGKFACETEGFSGADLKALCTDAALGPIRELGAKALEVGVMDVPPISYRHFRKALRGMKPSVAKSDLEVYLEFDRLYGSKSVAGEEDEDSEED